MTSLRSLLLLLLLLGRVLTLLAVPVPVLVPVPVPVPVLTINSPDGDIIDCIKKEDQIAFQNPLLRNHTLQDTPTGLPQTVVTEEAYGWQIWHKNGTRCPEGSIPIRRLTPPDLNGTTIGSNAADRLTTNEHEYGIGRMKSRPKIYGTQATMNVWQPKIEGYNEFSLGQIWLVSGGYNSADINTIEAGWQVYPRLYHDYQPRLFIYWTADTYNKTGCYNLRCGGFVQTSRTIVVEGAFAQTSTFGGNQVDLTIKIWKDQKLESWWMGVILDHSVVEPVGYWPTILFTIQTDFAEKVEWGGEIINKKTFGRHTTTQMGSGYFPDSGFAKTAYMSNIEIALSGNNFQPLQDLVVGGSQTDYYRAKKSKNPKLGAHFYYGGPLDALAIHLTWDATILYICLVAFYILIC